MSVDGAAIESDAICELSKQERKNTLNRREIKRGILCLLGTLAISGLVLAGCGKEKAKEQDGEASQETTVVLTTGFAKDEIFRIGKSSCTLPEAMVFLVNMQNQYENVYGAKIWEKNYDDESLPDKLKDIVVARMAQIKTMNLLAQEYGVILDAAEEEKVKKAAKTYYSSLNKKEIEHMKVDETIVENLYREYALANKVYNTIIEDVNPEISDDEARTITVQTIFIKTYALDAAGKKVSYTEASKKAAKKKAEEIRELSVSGNDFNQLISKYNEGEKSSYSFGKGEMEKSFEEAAFNLGTDEISGVVETENGYYIIKCISTFDRKETDANKEKIVEKRKKEAFNQVYDDFVSTQLRNMNDKLWDEVTLIEDEEVTTSSFFQIYNDSFGDS